MDRKEAERIYDAGREAVVEALMAFDARIRKLKETIARLTRNSSNSSRPPSSDPPGSTKLKRKKPSRRKQGGQPGHKGKKRELLPAAEMDHIHDLFSS